MELVLQFLLVFLVSTQSGGARLLDHEDSSTQKNPHIEDKPLSVVGQMSLQHSHGEQVLSSGQSPGVGHVSVHENVHIKGMLALSSGQIPGVGHVSVHENAQIEEMLPSGDSPGVGHMSIHNAHLGGMHSSGQSPAVGHMAAQHPHIDGVLSSGQSLPQIDLGNKLGSGSSPGVGHMAINSQKSWSDEVVIAVEEEGKSVRVKEEAGHEVGSMELTSLSGGEGPYAGHKNDGGVIGCPDAGQTSGSGRAFINMFDETSYYGAPTSLLFPLQR